MSWRGTAIITAVLIVLAGCRPGTPTTGNGQGLAGREAAAGSSAALTKEGWFGIGGGFHERLEIQRVDRYPDKSVLRFFVTSLEDEAETPRFGVSGAGAIYTLQFKLVDPIGRKLYYPMYDANESRQIDVKPFYRDGPYLVAVFAITNLGPGGVSWIYGYEGVSSGTFGAFSVVDPASKTVYRGVRIGPDNPNDYEDAYVDAGAANFRENAGTTNRGFFYVPAPPADVKSVTFDAGPFGQIPGIPIAQ